MGPSTKWGHVGSVGSVQALLDVRAGTWVLPNVPGTFFLSYLLGLIRGLYRQTKYVLGPSDSIIYEYAIVINMACGGALVMAL